MVAVLKIDLKMGKVKIRETNWKCSATLQERGDSALDQHVTREGGGETW